MNMKLKMLLKMVFIRSVRARLKMKKLVTVLILLFPENIFHYYPEKKKNFWYINGIDCLELGYISLFLAAKAAQ